MFADFGVSTWQTKEGKFISKPFYLGDKEEYEVIQRSDQKDLVDTPLIDIRLVFSLIEHVYLINFFLHIFRLCGLVFLKILQVGNGVNSLLTSYDATGI